MFRRKKDKKKKESKRSSSSSSSSSSSGDDVKKSQASVDSKPRSVTYKANVFMVKTEATPSTPTTTHTYSKTNVDYQSTIAPREPFARQTMHTSTSGGGFGQGTTSSGAGGGRPPFGSGGGGGSGANFSGGRVLKMTSEMGSGTAHTFGAELSKAAAKNFLNAAVQEKEEMQSLNERLGSYIDRVKALEAKNKELVAALVDMRGSWGADTRETKVKYATELSSLRTAMDEAGREKGGADIQLARLRDDIDDYKRLADLANAAKTDDLAKITNLTSKIANCREEAQMLNDRMRKLGVDGGRLTEQNAGLWSDLGKARNDLDAETLARVDFQNQAQTLLEELDFLRQIHDQEVVELQGLLNTQPADNKEYFKNEVALAIRDIKDEYATIQVAAKADTESWYRLKVQEVAASTVGRTDGGGRFAKDESTRVRTTIHDTKEQMNNVEAANVDLEKRVRSMETQLLADKRSNEAALNDRDVAMRNMRMECQKLVSELQTLLDTKALLDTEIAIYRKMLESEETRAGVKVAVRKALEEQRSARSSSGSSDHRGARLSSGGASAAYGSEIGGGSTRGSGGGTDMGASLGSGGALDPGGEYAFGSGVSHSDDSTRTTYQRSSKGNVAIAEADAEGRFVTVENTHAYEQQAMGGWRIRRTVEGSNGGTHVYIFPDDAQLHAGRSAQIWASGNGADHSPPNTYVYEGDTTWGRGDNVNTILLNEHDEEVATHLAKTVHIL